MTVTRIVERSTNARDLGWLRAGAHGWVRAGLWYRCAAAGVPGLLAQRRLRTVIDLRSPQESLQAPLSAGLDVCSRPIEVSRRALRVTDQPQPAHYLAYYRQLASIAAEVAAELLGVLAEADRLPVAVCCTLGKDRTSVVCGLALRALGVRLRDIAADHHLTSRLLRSSDLLAGTEWAAALSPQALDRRLAAAPGAMRALIKEVEAAHGSAARALMTTSLRQSVLDRARLAVVVNRLDLVPGGGTR